MDKKYNSRLSVRVCTALFGLIIIFGVIICTSIGWLMPRTYMSILEPTFEKDFNTLAENLRQGDIDTKYSLIDDFALKHNVTVEIRPKEGEPLYVSQHRGSWQELLSTGIAPNTIIETGTNKILVDNTMQTLYVEILPLVAIPVIILALLSALFFHRYITKPIIDLSTTAQKMVSEKTELEFNTKRTDEIGLLANSLNTLSHELNLNIQELEENNQLLEEAVQREAKLREYNNYLFSAISHEMKTPLTILSCNIEGMINSIGKYRDRDLYLSRSLSTIRSMQDLLREILLITRAGNDGYALTKEDVNISALLLKLKAVYEPIATDKAQIFHIDIPSEYVVPCNEKLMEKAVSNILSNAIMYSPKGAVISITFDQTGELTVKNTGTTIPPQDIENLFNPLYRVEQSRNKNSGGSGLGLFFVDRILKLHSFPYSINSDQNEVVFKINFR